MDWPSWEDREYGWDVVDGELHFEGQSVEHLLPPHLPARVVEVDPDMAPEGPWNNPNSKNRDFTITWPFENGWAAVVQSDWGVALNPAVISGVNYRLLGDRMPRMEPITGDSIADMQLGEWSDPSLVWQPDEIENVPGFEGLSNYLEDPDHLLACLHVIATLPSHR